LDFWNDKLPLILLLKFIKLFITVFEEKHYVPPSWNKELMLQQTYLGNGLKKPTSQHYALLFDWEVRGLEAEESCMLAS
jgi:hypothetical protein